ncbi:hypothetical protein ACERNI_13435 [Camelimonas sp. ID_303_24]
MSACNIIQEADAIHIWTDAAVYTPSGDVLAFVPKTFLLPGIGAMAVSGDLVVANALAMDAMAAQDSFDGVLARLPGYMAQVFDSLSASNAGYTVQPTVARLAGWSESRQRLEVWSAGAGETAHHEAGKAVLIDRDDVVVSPASPELMTRLEAVGLVDADGLNAETPADWLQVMREQRACIFPYEFGGGRPIRMVGGFAQHTVVTRDTLTTRVVERWGGG